MSTGLTLMQQQKIVDSLTRAIAEVRRSAEAEVNVTHQRHMSLYYRECLSILESEVLAQQARLKRIEVVGR